MLSSLRSRAVPLFLVFVAIALGALPTGGAVAAAKDPTTRGSAGCGNAATSGSSTRHVTVDGVQRDYLLSIPSDYRAAKPAPLLFDFHGFTSSMQEQSAYTKFNQQGGARGYVVITPNGQGDLLRRWSLIPAASANPDVAFVQAMLRTTTGALCIDVRRIFATGISNGAMFSTVLACALPGRLAAIAPVAGVNAADACAPRTPHVSVLAFHGTADPIVPYQGGDYFSGAPLGRLFSVTPAKPVDAAVAAWAAFDGCATPSTQSFVGADVQRIAWPDCPATGTVELYRVIGGGHTWPGATPVRADQLGATTSSIDATTLILDFFDAHPRRR